MLRSISLTRRSYSFSNSFARCYRLKLTIRLNHNQARTSQLPLEITEGLFLHESYNPLWSATAPLTEATSLDDFGASSTIDYSNASDIPLHQYLDSILRPYPATIEPTLELGGRGELNETERDSLETALSEGYDVSAVLGDLYSSSIEQTPVQIEETPKRNPDLDLIGFKSVSTAANVENVTRRPFQSISILPEMPSTSYDIPYSVEEKETIDLLPHEQVLEAFEKQDFNALKKALASNPWPTAYELGPQVKEILSFVIEHSTTSLEAYQLLEKFVKVNPKYYLRDDVLLPLGIRDIEENGITSATELLKKAKNLPFVRSSRKAHGPSREQYQSLFSSATKKGNLGGAIQMFKSLSQLNMLNIQLGVRAWVEVILTTDSLEMTVNSWKTISTLTGTTEGVDLLWDKVLLAKDGSEYIGSILKHSEKMEHSLITLSELICALIKNQKIDEAKMVFSKVYLLGRHLRKPLKRFVTAEDLASIEALASLVTDCLFAEKRIRKPAKEDPVSLAQKSRLSEALAKSVDTFSGRPPKVLMTKVRKDLKIKRHKVNEEQLYELATAIRDSWYKIATDEKSKKSLNAWCDRNGVMKLT